MKAILIGGSWHGRTMEAAPVAFRIHMPIVSQLLGGGYSTVPEFQFESYLRTSEPVLDYHVYVFETGEPEVEAEQKPDIIIELLTALRANPGALDREIGRAVRRIEALRFR